MWFASLTVGGNIGKFYDFFANKMIFLWLFGGCACVIMYSDKRIFDGWNAQTAPVAKTGRIPKRAGFLFAFFAQRQSASLFPLHAWGLRNERK